MTHPRPIPNALFRHSAWGVLAQVSLLGLCAGVVRAQNSPVFTYSSPSIGINAIATDSAGNTYLAGIVAGPIATTPGAFQSQDNSSGDCGFAAGIGVGIPCNGSYVEKLDPTGAVLFATYFSGNGETTISAIAVDPQGNVYLGGSTSPPFDSTPTYPLGSVNTFPVTPGAAFASGGGFVTKMNPQGTGLVYSTFIPASVSGLAIDPEGNAYIIGTGSLTFPATPGAFQTSPANSGNNPFPGVVAKLNASGSALVYATYLSGSGGENGGDSLASIAVDAAGDAFIAGAAQSPDFPVTPGAFLTTNPGVEAANVGGSGVFLTKLNPQGTGLVYSTYLCVTQGNDFRETVKVDAQGTAYVGGWTNPRLGLFPTTRGELSSSATGGFLTRFSADGASLVYSTYLSAAFQSGAILDVDSAGNAVVASATSLASLPTGVGTFQPGYAGGSSDIYIEKFTPQGQVAGGTYLGGSQADGASVIALSPDGSVAIAGTTLSPDFPGITSPGNPTVAVAFVTNIFVSLTAENAGSYVATQIAPGEIVALRGYWIGPSAAVSATGPDYSTLLDGMQVSIGGYPAPLIYAQAQQINLQVPYELAGQTSAEIEIYYPGVPSTPTPVVVAPTEPGIFFIENSDGSFNSPSNPAHAGDFVAVYGTGAGVMNPPGVTGQAWPAAPLSSISLPVSATVGGQSAGVLYSGSAPTLESGFFQINLQLPADLASGAQSATVTVGGVASAPAVISIQ